MNTAEAVTFSILVGSAVGMILVGLAVVIAAATAPPARNPRPEDSDSDSDNGSGSGNEGESDDPRPLTKTGRYLTDDDIAALADEAEAGYDPNQISGGRIRRGSLRKTR